MARLDDFPNYGVLETKLEEKHIDLLYDYIRESAPNGYEFDGNEIVNHSKDNQWQLTDHYGRFTNEVLMPNVKEYMDKWGPPLSVSTTHYHQLCLNRFWVRATTKDQYQGIHDHHSALSFVIWLKIPTDWEEEQKGDMGFAHPDATDFIFLYTDCIGKIRSYNYKLSPDCEGTMLVFPSELNHCVMPGYTQSGYRISVAGDVSFDSFAAMKDQIVP